MKIMAETKGFCFFYLKVLKKYKKYDIIDMLNQFKIQNRGIFILFFRILNFRLYFVKNANFPEVQYGFALFF